MPQQSGARSGDREADALRSAFAAELGALGLPQDAVVLVQAAYSRVARGPRDGSGPEALIDALLDRLGPWGTLVAYAATPENSRTTPDYARATAPMTESERRAYDAALPAFDRATTPVSPAVGIVSERLRNRPGAHRSDHPQTSFTALGREAESVTAEHGDEHLGLGSPLGKLYDRDGFGLLIGVSWSRFTPFHLADYKAPTLPMKTYHAKVATPGARDGEWIAFRDLDLHEGHFEELGKYVEVELESRGRISRGRVGDAPAMLVPIRPAVDIALDVLRAGLVTSRPWRESEIAWTVLTDHQ
ncbi:aminoglycoside N(3)-acetyltransferase [Streptacidiphilus melanogenes]|uniref:aminoglycoside N(3)-acetyltransferase n=1 Tax=Streptacidiphilus melanogenes TaxID=411235 RepID=UPI0013649B48|nr:AAC(3) family N-acetyltransferase [Streptacidiphilus melanogenes]